MSSIKLFQDKKIRSVWDETEQQWYFSVVDVVAALTDSVNPTDYLKKMRKRDASLAAYLGTNCPQVEMMTESGKRRKVLAANIKGLFRIIQSIPSSKAEPFKLWLAQVGYDRIQEIENPELAQERMKELYEQKGYPKDWIDKRLRGIWTRFSGQRCPACAGVLRGKTRQPHPRPVSPPQPRRNRLPVWMRPPG